MGRVTNGGVRFLPLPMVLLSIVFSLWGCSDISVLTALKAAELNARLWARTLTAGTNTAIYYGVALDASGNIYAAGGCDGTATYGLATASPRPAPPPPRTCCSSSTTRRDRRSGPGLSPRAPSEHGSTRSRWIQQETSTRRDLPRAPEPVPLETVLQRPRSSPAITC